ncbi:MAG TPA: hypothetical protein VL333_13100 [Candidatus Saccharimonadales bacterium]|jgi:hypothetical protein|nr:hypothetical protein [Candidatus Saccharimonadales bacterium]
MKTKLYGEIRDQSPLAQEIKRARKAKRAKLSRDEYITRTCKAIREAGKRGKWGAASIAMSCADVTEAADEIYGKEPPIETRGAMAHEATIISERGIEHGVVEGNDIRVTARPAQQD